MKIQTEYMSFINSWTISSSYDSLAHQLHSQKNMLFLPDCSAVIRGASRLVSWAPRLAVGTPRIVIGASRPRARARSCSQVHPMISQVLWGIPNRITITPIQLLSYSLMIPLPLKASRNALLVSRTLPKLTQLSLHSTSSQTVLKTPSD